MSTSYENHALCEVLPPLTKEEYKRIKDDMKQYGYDRDLPIILFEGKILDGRHRYKIAMELELEPSYIEFEGDSNDALAKVMRTTKDRNLSVGQRAAIASGLANLTHGGKREKEQEPNSSLDPVTLSDAAKLLGISQTSIKAYRKVEKHAPDVAKQVKSGETSLGAGESFVRGIQQEEEKQTKQGHAEWVKQKEEQMAGDPEWEASAAIDDIAEKERRQTQAQPKPKLNKWQRMEMHEVLDMVFSTLLTVDRIERAMNDIMAPFRPDGKQPDSELYDKLTEIKNLYVASAKARSKK